MKKRRDVNLPISQAVSAIFWNSALLPNDPYRYIISTLQRYEFDEDIPKPLGYTKIMQDAPLPSDYQQFVKLSILGSRKVGGLLHLGRVISDKAIEAVMRSMSVLKSAMGDCPSVVKSTEVEANYIEVVALKNAFSKSICSPRLHTLEVTVEAVLQGVSFDACINTFIRRVVEEAYHADVCPYVVTSNIHVEFSGRRSESYVISVESLKIKREQMISILKSAIVDDGSIFLDMYIYVVRTLPSLVSAGNLPVETAGFIHVVRRYNFSYIDSRTSNARCFSSNPLESLALGLFVNPEDMRLYSKVYLDHTQRMKASKTDAAAASATAAGSSENGQPSRLKIDRMVLKLVRLVGKKAGEELQGGEVGEAATCWMLLCLTLTPNRTTEAAAPYLQAQISSILSSQSGCFRSVRDAVEALSAVCGTLGRWIADSAAVLADESAALDETQTLQFSKLIGLYDSVGPAILEVQVLVMHLLRGVQNSEFAYSAKLLHGWVLRLFKKNKSNSPIGMIDWESCSEDKMSFGRRFLSSKGQNMLADITLTLDKISLYLKMMESSSGFHIVSSLLVNDCASMVLLPPKGVSPSEATSSSTSSSTSSPPSRPLKSFTRCPVMLTELLGYAEAALSDGATGWTAFRNIDSVRYFLTSQLLGSLEAGDSDVGTNSIQQAVESARREANAEARAMLQRGSEERLLQGHVLDVVHSIVMGSYYRVPGYDVDAAMLLGEQQTGSLPRYLQREEVAFSYLSQTLALQALHEGAFVAASRPVRRPWGSLAVANIFRYSSYYQLHSLLDDATLLDFAFQPIRKCLLDRVTVSGVEGADPGLAVCLLEYRGRNILSGAGLYGHHRLLTGAGCCSEVYQQAWLIPPLSPGGLSTTHGIRTQLFCGIAFDTALQLSLSTRPTIDSANVGQQQQHKEQESLVRSDLERLRYSPGVVLEVVLLLSYEQPSLRCQLEADFASAVSKCVQFMCASSGWHVASVGPGTQPSSREVDGSQFADPASPTVQSLLKVPIPHH